MLSLSLGFQAETRRVIPEYAALLYVYGTLLVPVIFVMLIGLNIIAWSRTRINYIFIFGAGRLETLLSSGSGLTLIDFDFRFSQNSICGPSWIAENTSRYAPSLSSRPTLIINNHVLFPQLPAFLFMTLCYAFWISFSHATTLSVAVSPTTWPLAWLIFALSVLFNPLPVFLPSSRWWLIRSTWKLFMFTRQRVEVKHFLLSFTSSVC